MEPGMARVVTIATVALACLPLPSFAQTEPLLPLPPPPVTSQTPPAPGEPTIEGQSVAQRLRPELAPVGLRLGSYFFYPRAEVDEAYNDNIFATAANAVGDFITTLMPSFDLMSNFPTSGLNFHGGAAIGTYASHSALDYQDAYGAVDGHIDLSALNRVYGGLRLQQLHEEPGSPEFPGNAREPVLYHTYSANIGDQQSGTILGYKADASVLRQEFQAVPATGGGLIYQSDRNATVYDGALEGDYERVPGNQIYLRGEGDYRAYDHAAGNGIPIRTSQGARVDLGTRVDLTGITFVDGYVGYLQQDYQSSLLGTISGVDFGGHVIWNATTLTTVTLHVDRSVQDIDSEVGTASGVSYALSPGYLHTIAGLNIDHELLRNLLLNANVSYFNDAFKGISRNDDNFTGSIGAKYLLNRNLFLGLTDTLWSRNSTGSQATNNFTQNIVLLRLSTQL